MPTDREELRLALHLMLNDVIEQAFQILVHHPQQSDEINLVINQASDELNIQIARIDELKMAEPEVLQRHYDSINLDVHRKSLEMLSRLQKVHPPELETRGLKSD